MNQNRAPMIRVRKDLLCPVCQKNSWCLVAEDGTAAICARVESPKPVGNKGAGWLHRLSDTPIEPRFRPKRRKVDQTPPPDFSKLVPQCEARLKDMSKLCNRLGVSEESLRRLNVGWNGKCYTFPMRDGWHRFVGIRLRSRTGKFAVRGSKNALFWPIGVGANSKNILFICEGPTDTAAMLDLGFDAIGRASCNTGKDYIIQAISDYDRQVVIMADKDEPKKRPDGSINYPGIEGAMKLAEEIKPVVRSVRVIKPPKHKDMRAWLQAGATKAKVMLLVDNARFI